MDEKLNNVTAKLDDHINKEFILVKDQLDSFYKSFSQDKLESDIQSKVDERLQ